MSLEYDPPLDPNPTGNFMLIGPPKSGKSAGAASAPPPVLHLNADLPARMRYARLRYGDERVRPVTVQGRDTLIAATHAAQQPKPEFKTVVVDPIGELFDLLMYEARGGKPPSTMNNAERDRYRTVGNEVHRFCKALCKAPINVVLVCHDYPVKDEATGEVERLPWTGSQNPKLGRSLMGMVDVVAYTGRVETEDGAEYVAQLVPAKGRPGGDGFDCLANERGLRALDLSEWMQVIKAHEKQVQEAGAGAKSNGKQTGAEAPREEIAA